MADGAREDYKDSELVIGLAGPVGADLPFVQSVLENRLVLAGYEVKRVHVAEDIIERYFWDPKQGGTGRAPEDSSGSGSLDDAGAAFSRAKEKMKRGTLARQMSELNEVLALGTATVIQGFRDVEESEDEEKEPRPLPAPRRAYLIKSLKHPGEVRELRRIYEQSFYLIGVYSGRKDQIQFLRDSKGLTTEEAEELIERDRLENDEFGKAKESGQRLNDTFQMSDFFLRLERSVPIGDVQSSLYRFLSLLFANPHGTPTPDEYAMFVAFSTALRSSALSRQVGAVITKDGEILATGYNDDPRFGGGVYCEEAVVGKVGEYHGGLGREKDVSDEEKQALIEAIVDDAIGDDGIREGITADKLREVLARSGIRDLTEYGREVHAEMEALLSCSRRGISAKGAELYTTTFPCHNCVKHIVAAGITRVVYVEPYQKSLATRLYGDVVHWGEEHTDPVGRRIKIEPYTGVGPRRFFDLFSIRHGSGPEVKRKYRDGTATRWDATHCNLRHQMRPNSYIDLEINATKQFKQLVEFVKSKEGKES